MNEESKTSKAQQKAVNKYVKNNYDRINVTFPKGRKEEIKAHAEANGESVNAFIIRAVNETMDREGFRTAAALQVDTRPDIPQNDAPPANAQNLSEEKPPKKSETKLPYLPLTPENIAKVDLDRLANDFRYQLDVGEAFGMESLAQLLDMARQQEKQGEAVSGADQQEH